MAGKGGKKGNGNTIIIRREEVVAGGHHGGAWKVAYADFVTAMMAFFLLMWLINATTQDQRKGLADYFSPTNILSHGSSGVGKPFSGHTPTVDGGMISDRGAVQVINGRRPVVDAEDDDSDIPAQPRPYRRDTATSQDQPPEQETATAPTPRTRLTGQLAGRPETALRPSSRPDQENPLTSSRPEQPRPPTAEEIQAERERQERAAFEQAAEQIREAVRADPALAELARQLSIDMTPEGLRIQIMDEERVPMFATGSAALNDRARQLLQKVVPVLQRLPQQISIAGHTDATPYRGTDKTNWELSTERGNATRRMLLEAGMPDARIRNVTGHADRDPLLPADPLAAANRRIAIVVLHSPRSAAPPARP
jgi:chemotaxis protein MotB